MNIDYFSSDPAVIIFSTVIGFAMLIMGRQIFWVFIAGLGFVMGLIFSSQYYNAQFEWRILLISTIVAVVGVVLAYTLQRFAAGIGGFATGWYLTLVLMSSFRIDLGQFNELVPIIIGIIAGVAIMAFFDWGVIIASSIAGSAIIVSGMTLARNTELALLVMFALVGMAIQGIWFMQDR